MQKLRIRELSSRKDCSARAEGCDYRDSLSLDPGSCLMSRNNNLALAVRRALVLGAASTVALIQPVHAADEGTIQEVVVTGSRIAQPGLTSISPVTAVGSDQIKIEGITRVEDLINNLPQAFADFGGNLSNGSTGAATVNLRGLGSQRTLGAREQPATDAG